MLVAEKISLEFEKSILKRVSFKLLSGELVGLVGKSGAGKSSFLKILAGFLQSDEGKVFFNDTELPPVSSLLIPGYKKIALVNQDFKLDPYHSVEENIRESILNLPNDKREKQVKKMLRLLELTHIANNRANQISGGEQQRVALARAISVKPDFLLLDEPFGHLDPRLRNKLKDYLLRIREEENTGILLVSHDEHDILGLCDSVCTLKNGVLSKKQLPEELYYNLSNTIQATIFGQVNSIIHNNEKILFRPDEFEIAKSGIPVQYIRSIFAGGYYENIFLTNNKERIILYHSDKLTNVSQINVRRKNFK
ncbi:MAG: ATP-binding cassette domain-containing protein [Crocinitomicaceae bacterium]|jgi:ABC-type sulfate/molybdate transport systems ATPase subunit